MTIPTAIKTWAALGCHMAMAAGCAGSNGVVEAVLARGSGDLRCPVESMRASPLEPRWVGSACRYEVSGCGRHARYAVREHAEDAARRVTAANEAARSGQPGGAIGAAATATWIAVHATTCCDEDCVIEPDDGERRQPEAPLYEPGTVRRPSAPATVGEPVPASPSTESQPEGG